MSDKNKALMRRVYEEVYTRGKLDAVDELTSSDFVLNRGGQSISGREPIKAYVSALRQGIPDLQITIKEQVAEGDRVVTRWNASGTHQGAFQGIPPTGRRFTIRGIDINRVVGDKAVECWTVMDELSLLQQLGLAPAPAQ